MARKKISGAQPGQRPERQERQEPRPRPDRQEQPRPERLDRKNRPEQPSRSKEEEVSPKKKGRWKKPALVVLVLSILGGGGFGVYRYVLNPPMQERDEEKAPISAVRRMSKYLAEKDWDGLKKEINADSYLGLEYTYANGNESIQAFLDNVIGKTELIPKKEQAVDIYGKPMINKETGDAVLVDSLVKGKKDTITVRHVDYSQITFNTNEVLGYLKSQNVEVGSPDYKNQVIPVFCDYLNSLNWGDIPMKDTEHHPETSKNKLTSAEDTYLDDLLFASEEFNDMLNRFDIAVNNGKEPVTAQWAKWNKLDAKRKKKTKEPVKYNERRRIGRTWCGAHYLQTGYTNEKGEKEVINAQSGDGTVERPATMGTSILTYVLGKDGNKEVANPIRVELTDVKTEEDCQQALAEKDNRNRGLNEDSQTKYAYLTFKVTNISNKNLNIKDNSSLADKSGNLSGRTGRMYGLVNNVTLKPNESATIESWVSSTELDRKYLIWGANFNRKAPAVYFKVFFGAK